MKSRRRRAREIAFQALYQHEHGQNSRGDALGQLLLERRAGPDVSEYARLLVETVEEHGDEIDASIVECLDHWNLERLAAVDRNILRVAAGEMLHSTEVPPEVVINEAVDIAKKYSTENSGAFVNGVLDRLWRVSGGGAVREGGD